MDDRQSLAFDKLMKDQKKKKATLLTIVLVAAVLVFLLGLLFGIAISSNSLAVPAGAEDLVREDPVLSLEEHVVLRSSSAPEYIISVSGSEVFESWLIANGYTSPSSVFRFEGTVYRYSSSDPSSSVTVASVYAADGGIYGYSLGGDFLGFDSTLLLAFDSSSLYHFFRFTVGLGYSDFVVYGFDQPIAVAEDTVASIFTVGDKLLAFVTDNVLVLIPLVLFLGVFAFGSIKRLITGV